MVLHDLFVVATQSGRTDSALDYARSAFRHYGASHSSIPRLTHDIAYVWLEQGHFERAAAVLKALAPVVDYPDLAVLIEANLARAAGNLGNLDQFQRSWTETMRRIRTFPAAPTVAAAFLELGMGAAALGDWDRATEALQKAIEEARKSGANAVRLRAESMLEAVGKDRKFSRPAVTDNTDQQRTADLFADRMVRALTHRRTTVRR